MEISPLMNEMCGKHTVLDEAFWLWFTVSQTAIVRGLDRNLNECGFPFLYVFVPFSPVSLCVLTNNMVYQRRRQSHEYFISQWMTHHKQKYRI